MKITIPSLIVMVLIIIPPLAFAQQPQELLPYKNPQLPVKLRVQDLLSRMTLEEKTAQLLSTIDRANKFNQDYFNDTAAAGRELGNGIGTIQPDFLPLKDAVAHRNAVQKYLMEKTRLGIPAIFVDEGLHGLMKPEATSFPQAIGLACSWDVKLFEEVFTTIAAEMRSRGTHLALTPVVDVCRDPRWGRVEETYGEDPYLNGVLGAAAVAGFQGSLNGIIASNHVASTLKHFTGHGQSENGLNQAPANYSERVLREFHMFPFEYIVQHSRPAAVMPAFVEVDGIPCHANTWLLKQVLRGEWGFKGLVVSDYEGIDQLSNKHMVAADAKQAALLAFNAGVDCDLPRSNNYPYLPELINGGAINTAALDSSVARVLRLKFQMGLFENPFVDELNAQKISKLPASRDLALRAAHESIVLLKNEDNLLPLSREKYRKIAVMGPFSNQVFTGGYSGQPYQKTSLYDGIKNKVGDHCQVVWTQGCKLTTNATDISQNNWVSDEIEFASHEENLKYIAEAVDCAARSDIVIVAVGENEQLCREAWSFSHLGDAVTLDLLGDQEELVKAVMAAGKPVVVCLTNGRPLSINYIAGHASAIIEGWYLGQECGTALADVLFGDVNPSGKLTISFAKSIGQLPIYYNRKPSARSINYITMDSQPLFPFGFGKSYTTYKYGNLNLESDKIPVDGSTTVSVDVTNTGRMQGDEIVQLYIRDKISSVTRPVKELKDFSRITLEPGESKTVKFVLDKSKLAFWDVNMKYTVEPGVFEVMVGSSSAEIQKVDLIVE
jgi:beta-glucosidase